MGKGAGSVFSFLGIPAELQQSPSKPKRSHPFLRGPVPMEWLERAGRLPGKALHVAVGICHLHGFDRTTAKVILRPSVVRRLGVGKDSAHRAINALEADGLISVERHRGRAPIVTIRGEMWSKEWSP